MEIALFFFFAQPHSPKKKRKEKNEKKEDEWFSGLRQIKALNFCKIVDNKHMNITHCSSFWILDFFL